MGEEDQIDWSSDTGWDDTAQGELTDYLQSGGQYADDVVADDGTTQAIQDQIASQTGFSASALTNLFNSSPALVKALGSAGVGALANKIFGSGSSGPGGYQGGIPTLTASREMLPIPTTMTNAAGQTVARRPGSGGITYFTPMQYLNAAQVQAKAAEPVVPPPPAETVAQQNPTINDTYASGGITTLGSYSDGGRLLRGPGDGVSDSIPATIGKGQPARLADGEFVIPARIVSELGNGSTEAGARKLYAMMDRIKKTRSKAKNIAANTKADKHLPA